MKLSAVLIVKNEEVMLPRCLDSLKGVDEIVICDTGSVDKTVEVAKRYTDKVVFYQWDDSFCRARNAAKSYATGDWIISIDADEFLNSVDEVRKAIALAEAAGENAIEIRMQAEDGDQFFLFPRIFKNIPECYWNGDIHNHLSVYGKPFGNVIITHGYSPAHASDPDRTLRILKKAVEQNPGLSREKFYLGREYYYRGQYQDAVIMLGRYVVGSRYLAEKAEAFLIMSRCFWAQGMPDDARDAIVQALICNANFKEAILFMAQLAGDGSGNEAWQKNADQWKRMAETADNSNVLFIRT